MGSETKARVMGFGPICDRCETHLEFHGQTMAGQACDLGLEFDALWRSIGEAVFGPRRYARMWRAAQASDAAERARREVWL